MAVLLGNWVFETSLTTGTGDLLLNGSVQAGYWKTFSQISPGSSSFQVYYTAEDKVASLRETGIGTYNANTNTISRDNVLDGTNGPGNLVSFPSGSVRYVFSEIPAQRIVTQDTTAILTGQIVTSLGSGDGILIAGSDTTSPTVSLSASGVTAGSYSPLGVTVAATGQITAIDANAVPAYVAGITTPLSNALAATNTNLTTVNNALIAETTRAQTAEAAISANAVNALSIANNANAVAALASTDLTTLTANVASQALQVSTTASEVASVSLQSNATFANVTTIQSEVSILQGNVAQINSSLNESGPKTFYGGGLNDAPTITATSNQVPFDASARINLDGLTNHKKMLTSTSSGSSAFGTHPAPQRLWTMELGNGNSGADDFVLIASPDGTADTSTVGNTVLQIYRANGTAVFSGSALIAPTPAAGDNSNSVATTAWVNTAVSGAAGASAALAATNANVATLAATVSNLTGALIYRGSWNAATNLTSTGVALSNGTGTQGDFWRVSTAGVNLGHTWNVGDDVIYNGTTYDKITGDDDDVISVAGRTGAVVLTVSDIAGAASNTDLNALSANVTSLSTSLGSYATTATLNATNSAIQTQISGLSTSLGSYATVSALSAANSVLSAQITAESTARIAADASLQTSVTALSTSLGSYATVSALSAANSAIQAEIVSTNANVAQVVTGLTTTNANVSTLSTTLSTETAARQANVASLTASINAISASSNTVALATALSTVSANTTALQTNVSGLSSNVATIQTSLGSYATTAALSATNSAIQVQISGLSTSVANAASNTISLQTSLSSTNASLASTQLAITGLTTSVANAATTSALTTETTARVTADGVLQANITAVQTSLSGYATTATLNAANSALSTLITTETAARISADSTLQANIAAVVSGLTSANAVITTLGANSGVTAGTYGSASLVPVITVNAQGKVTAVSNVAVSGGSGGLPLSGGTLTGPVVINSGVSNAITSLSNVSVGLIFSSGNNNAQPTITVGPGAGTGAGTGISGNANDMRGYIGVYTGTGTTAGTVFTINFSKPFAVAPYALIQAASSGAAQYATSLYSAQPSTTAITVSTTTAIPASTFIFFQYIVLG